MLTTISRVVLFTIFISVITGKILEGWDSGSECVWLFQIFNRSKMIHIIEVASIATPASRISGDATLVKDGDFPFMVSVTLNDAHICGGFIYNSRFIVTAASCVYQYNVFF